MKSVFWLGLLVLALPLLGQEAAKEFSTPRADVEGQWAFVADPSLPNVLILGDSISIGYTRAVRAQLAGKANVYRPLNRHGNGPENCGDTEMGLASVDAWLADTKWSVIHCNWGLWDICYRVPGKPKAGNRDKQRGKIAFTTEDYAANLDKLFAKLQATGATVIWASTTAVPDGEVGRVAGDEVRYNQVAAALAETRSIPINDLHALTTQWAGKHSVAPGDVHFTAGGSELLGRQVAASILATLEAPR